MKLLHLCVVVLFRIKESDISFFLINVPTKIRLVHNA